MLIVLKSGSLNLLAPSGLVQACNGIALLLPLLISTNLPFLVKLKYLFMQVNSLRQKLS